jgi:hypothetical protein
MTMKVRGYCRNCTVRVKWGLYCSDCVRAWSIGAVGAFGAGVAGWMVRWLTR